MFIESVLLSLLCTSLFLGSMIGCVSAYCVVKKQGMLGDIMSHASLPGITFAFLFTKSSSPLLLLLGGSISALLSGIFFLFVKKIAPLPKNGALALSLSWFFNMGIIGGAIVQRLLIEGQGIVKHVFFGNFVILAAENTHWYMILSFLLSIFFIVTIKYQKVMIFDEFFARTRIPYLYYFEIIFLCLTVIAIIIGLQAVGILLMGSLIITPGTVARMITSSYEKMVFLSIIVSIFAFLIGVFGVYYFSNIPSGPIIALFPIILCIGTHIFGILYSSITGKS